MASRVLSTTEGTQQQHDFGPTEWLLFAIPPLIWGCSFLLIAIALDDFAPSVVTTLRIAFGALALGVFPAARRHIPARELPRLLFIAATWMAIPFSCFSIAEQWIDSSLAGMLNGAMPSRPRRSPRCCSGVRRVGSSSWGCSSGSSAWLP